MIKINVVVVTECNFLYQGIKSILLKNENNNITLKDIPISYNDFSRKKQKDTDIIIVNMQELIYKGIGKLHTSIMNDPTGKIIVCCVAHDDKKIQTLLAYGIKGILYNTDSPEIVVKAIKKVHDGELWIRREIMSQYIESSLTYSTDLTDYNENILTKRENEILFMLGKGVSNNEIAESIGVSLATVKTHIYRIFKKTRYAVSF